nr:somatic embryogenesis receptor kinase 4-like [Tanacetum cinerariifolium]
MSDMLAWTDPDGQTLTSWSENSGSSYCDGSFEGVACNEMGQVMNISLQGKGLFGKLAPEIGELKWLSGLYLHFNGLHGEIPKEIAELTHLTDLYLNVNNLTGEIPVEFEKMANLQATKADTRTMAEMLRVPTEGCEEAIVVPPILAEPSGQGICWEVMEGRGGSSWSGGEGRRKCRRRVA